MEYVKFAFSKSQNMSLIRHIIHFFARIFFMRKRGLKRGKNKLRKREVYTERDVKRKEDAQAKETRLERERQRERKT